MTTTHQQVQAQLRSTVAFIGSTGRRALDAVVFELANGAGKVQRTVVVKTSSTQQKALDSKRVQRTARRLRALGFRQNWASFGHPQDGIKGTVRMFRAA